MKTSKKSFKRFLTRNDIIKNQLKWLLKYCWFNLKLETNELINDWMASLIKS